MLSQQTCSTAGSAHNSTMPLPGAVGLSCGVKVPADCRSQSPREASRLRSHLPRFLNENGGPITRQHANVSDLTPLL